MRVFTRLSITAALVAAFAGATARPAHADIIVVSGVNNQGTDNVLLNNANDVSIVTGTLNSGAFDVNFVSTSGLLDADASGQAVVSAGADNDPFTNIKFFITDATFTRAVFNLNSATNGNVLLEVLGVNINGGLFQQTLVVGANGQNFFTVSAINGQLISSIELTAQGQVEFEDLRQVRIGGAVDTSTDTVPEPTSMLLLGSGLVGLVVARRRR